MPEGPFTDEPIVSEAEKMGLSRAQAIEVGRRLGEDEATRRRESEEHRRERVNRAMAYAAWEYDCKPAGRAHLKEFGVTTELTPSLERVLVQRKPLA